MRRNRGDGGGLPAQVSTGFRAARLCAKNVLDKLAPVAQMDRALPSEGRGQGFESLRVRHFSTDLRMAPVSRLTRRKGCAAERHG